MKKILTLFFVVFCFQIAKAGADMGRGAFPLFVGLIYIIWALFVYIILFFKNKIFSSIHLLLSIFIFFLTTFLMFSDDESKTELKIKVLLFYILIMFLYYFVLYKRLIKNNETPNK